MKNLFIIFTLFILFTGCSDKNAFREFKMSKDQELSISSLQSTKITSKEGDVNGLFSAIYLNEVYPDLYKDKECFFVYMYIKKSAESKLNLKLNSKLHVKLEELKKDNKFSHLVSIRSNWNKYYLATFEKDSSNTINLVFENGQSSSAVLVYQKDEQ